MNDPNESVRARCERARQMNVISAALREGIAECAGDSDAFLSLMPTADVRLLLEHLPTIAGPWRVVDMKRGEPTLMVRPGYEGEPIARVKARGKTWLAFVGNTLVEAEECDPDGMDGTVGWNSCDSARAACDARLARGGVRLDDESPLSKAEAHRLAFAPPFGTIRQCRVCGCLVAGGPTACVRCAEAGA